MLMELHYKYKKIQAGEYAVFINGFSFGYIIKNDYYRYSEWELYTCYDSESFCGGLSLKEAKESLNRGITSIINNPDSDWQKWNCFNTIKKVNKLINYLNK